MTVVARVYSGNRYKSALEVAKARARKEAQAVPMELPGFDGSTVVKHPQVRLYRAKDGAYVIERTP